MFIVHTCSDYINTAADTRSMRKQMPTAGGTDQHKYHGFPIILHASNKYQVSKMQLYIRLEYLIDSLLAHVGSSQPFQCIPSTSNKSKPWNDAY